VNRIWSSVTIRTHIEDRREAVLDECGRQHPTGMRFERSVGVIAAEDDDRVPRSTACSRGT